VPTNEAPGLSSQFLNKETTEYDFNKNGYVKGSI
jgi:hypothetical protein